MIRTGYSLTAEDVVKLNQFKKSTAYGTYIKSIIDSPIYISIVKQHVKNVNIRPDIVRLQSDGKLPDNVSPEALNKLFKDSISRVAINLVADTVMLKEIEDKNLDDVVYNMREDSNCNYLLGMAEDKYYREAQKRLERGEIVKGDLAYKGLVEWMKRRGTLAEESEEELQPEIEVKEVEEKTQSKKIRDYDSLNIEL